MYNIIGIWWIDQKLLAVKKAAIRCNMKKEKEKEIKIEAYLKEWRRMLVIQKSIRNMHASTYNITN